MASGHSLEGVDITRLLFPYPLYPKYKGGDVNKPDSFVAENDGSVRWNGFRQDTFYTFEIPEFADNPLVDGEGVSFFQPYDHDIVAPGTCNWWVWSPSMFDDMDYDG